MYLFNDVKNYVTIVLLCGVTKTDFITKNKNWAFFLKIIFFLFVKEERENRLDRNVFSIEQVDFRRGVRHVEHHSL